MIFEKVWNKKEKKGEEEKQGKACTGLAYNKEKRHHKECGTKVQPSIKGDGEYYTENMTRKSASFVTHDYDM